MLEGLRSAAPTTRFLSGFSMSEVPRSLSFVFEYVFEL